MYTAWRHNSDYRVGTLASTIWIDHQIWPVCPGRPNAAGADIQTLHITIQAVAGPKGNLIYEQPAVGHTFI